MLQREPRSRTMTGILQTPRPCIAAASLIAGSATPCSAIPPPPEPVPFAYETIGPRDYQVFVTHWTPPSYPLCRVIGSADEWSRIFQPAAVMNGNRPFAPPPKFWQNHVVLFLARSMPMGNIDDAIRVEGVNEIAGRLQVQLRFHAVDASATMNAWVGVVVERPDWLGTILFKDGQETVCTSETTPARP